MENAASHDVLESFLIVTVDPNELQWECRDLPRQAARRVAEHKPVPHPERRSAMLEHHAIISVAGNS